MVVQGQVPVFFILQVLIKAWPAGITAPSGTDASLIKLESLQVCEVGEAVGAGVSVGIGTGVSVAVGIAAAVCVMLAIIVCTTEVLTAFISTGVLVGPVDAPEQAAKDNVAKSTLAKKIFFIRAPL